VHVVILGNGIAGVTAARHLRKRDAAARITLVSGESDHHWSRPALMYIYLGHMKYRDTKPYEDDFWPRNRIELVRGWVTRLDVEGRRLEFADGRTLGWDKLVLATGSVPNRFGWPGQELRRVQGLYSLQDLVALEQVSPQVRRAVIVGGGLIGVELAEMLHSRGIHVTILVRERGYSNTVLPAEESAMVGRVLRRAGIDLRLSTELVEIHDDGSGAVGAVTTSAGDRLPCELVGLTAGVRPRIELAAAAGLQVGRGVRVDAQLRTSAPEVYAAGDCAEIVLPGGGSLVQQVWYTGRAQGEVVAANLCGEGLAYRPGTWFNSAKFFDLEYQVYGSVPVMPDAQHEHLYWEGPDGLRSLRVVGRGGVVVGMQAMGLRLRHRVCERWIAERLPTAEALARLEEAWFEPELQERPTAAVRAALGGGR
jgi:NADPH-dependent 2,4-dienoyl-CoA reductase/sulfur reductase-like enzyme